VPLLKKDGRLITLIKPQFEVGRGEVGKGGIVRDQQKHARVIEEINRAAQEMGLQVRKIIESPIRGADGNLEFLALYDKPFADQRG
jgi:23S rRNA (cytidine1920-2'-O)/16S rRNA (cytidine1409-2'-O)-methyltransferase